MFVVNSLPVAILFCVLTMLGWGSWANTQKLAGKEKWPFELFYWDYAIGVFLFGLVFAHTFGSFGTAGSDRDGEPARGGRRLRVAGADQRRDFQPLEHSAGGRHRRGRDVGRVSGRRRAGAGHRDGRELSGDAEGRSRAAVRGRRADRLRDGDVGAWRTAGCRAPGARIASGA